ncbi:hypothetical protein E2C01_004124 [Portunus trituberculatus]|uniref:Uncharacterized protein n=1 Tax=Portunus trituberculatus TaxID=210409 RepID=A0A5B7CP10_PORTR|nr:hypothetical protein [Portunus trituberculatus]
MRHARRRHQAWEGAHLADLETQVTGQQHAGLHESFSFPGDGKRGEGKGSSLNGLSTFSPFCLPQSPLSVYCLCPSSCRSVSNFVPSVMPRLYSDSSATVKQTCIFNFVF